MNKHILLIMKWLNDPLSVTLKELHDNTASAINQPSSAHFACLDAQFGRTEHARQMVKCYFTETGEDRAPYVEAAKS